MHGTIASILNCNVLKRHYKKMKHMKKITPLLIFILCYINIMAQNQVSKPEVKRPVYFDVSPPLRDLVKTVPKKKLNRPTA